MKSMTGFGRGAVDGESYSATVEIRSVNSRFCEVSVRTPRALSAHEPDIQSAVKQRFARGRLTVHVSVDRSPEAEPNIAIDHGKVRRYMQLLGELRTLTASVSPVDLDQLLGLPGVFVQDEAEAGEDEEAVWPLVKSALATAMDELVAMREAEGKALKDDLRSNAETLVALAKQVEDAASARPEAARDRLRERIDALLTESSVDRDRLEQEIALLADKLDISEELVRLKSHLQLYLEALDAPEPVGRKLNFIAQEINREINTIGSKGNDAEVARIVVAMKEALEKIREQVENVE